MKRRMRVLITLLVMAGLTATVARGTALAMTETDSTDEATLEITIRHSGLFSKKTTTIEYRSSDRKIVAVRENGREVPGDKLDQYRKLLGEALEVSELQDLIPELDAANRTFESIEVPAIDKVEELSDVMRKLEALESDFARTQVKMLEARKKLVVYGAAMDKIKVELEKSGIDVTNVRTIVIEDGRLYVDNERMARELSERCITIFEDVTGEKVESHGTALRWNLD